ncbi:NAD-dependent epimerase/dehydratase family protein [Micromonospora sp. NPDC005257]|uniref:NAD-dependent epimerase/dehydratase family protein n=1 Tax=unclassified Micromonospora TaxID=2617518 RepID=UPI0033B6F13F
MLGAAGFVGAAVSAALASRSARLRLVIHEQRLPLPPSATHVEFHAADLTRADEVREAVAGADAVIHVAAQIGGQAAWRVPGSSSERLGADLVDTVADALRTPLAPPPIFILASTTQLNSAHRANEYVRHKAAAEACLRESTERGWIRGITLRLPTVYGQSPLSGSAGRGVIAALARKAVAGEPITMWHDGSVRRDLLHVTDVGLAFVAALDHADLLSGGCWTIGTGTNSPLGDVLRRLARRVAARTGTPAVSVVSVPAPEWADAGDFDDARVDPAAFAAATGWASDIGLERGLESVVDAVLAER